MRNPKARGVRKAEPARLDGRLQRVPDAMLSEQHVYVSAARVAEALGLPESNAVGDAVRAGAGRGAGRRVPELGRASGVGGTAAGGREEESGRGVTALRREITVRPTAGATGKQRGSKENNRGNNGAMQAAGCGKAGMTRPPQPARGPGGP